MVDAVRDHWWWRPGWRLGRRAYTFHITFEDGTVEGGPDLRRLAAAYQAGLAGMLGLDLVPQQWLHLTIQNVGFTDEVGENEVQAIVDAAAARFAELAPFDLTFGAVEVRREAIAFRPTPAEPVSRLREAARSAIAAVRGPDGVPEVPEHAHGFEPHVSLAVLDRVLHREPFRIGQAHGPDPVAMHPAAQTYQTQTCASSR